MEPAGDRGQVDVDFDLGWCSGRNSFLDRESLRPVDNDGAGLGISNLPLRGKPFFGRPGRAASVFHAKPHTDAPRRGIHVHPVLNDGGLHDLRQLSP